MTEYKKLVRDRIPDIIRAHGETPITETLDDAAYMAALKAKLSEELQEFLESEEPEELADLMEVMYAIAEARGISVEQLESLRLKKREERGGFGERILLVAKE